MKLNIQKITLGMALAGATTFAGFATPASAKPKNNDVKQARQEVKEARRDVRRADTPEERRDARQDLREEKRDLREEKRENWNRGNNGNAYGGNQGRGRFDRPNLGRPGFDRDDSDRFNRPGIGYGRPNFGGPNYGRPAFGRPNFNQPNFGGNRSTLQGVVTEDLKGDDFVIRTSNGQTVRVYAVRGESGAISRGDTVQLSGSFNGNSFSATNVSVLRNR